MCPPVPIDEFCSDEGIFTSLLNIKNGFPLPSNVISDVNLYQFKPSDISADLWYLCSGEKTDEECGFWVEKGEACEIFSDSVILGSRTTLQFYEGRAPNARKTGWVMQEYRITEKCNNNPKDDRALCRIFFADEIKPTSDNPYMNKSGHVSKSELLENDTGPSLVVKRSPNPLESFPEMDYILTGDYLALDDLVDLGSRSSSSANSSCLTMTSEEYFDSMALLRELEDDSRDQEKKDYDLKFNLSISGKSKEVVIRPATSGLIRIGEDRKASTEGSSKVENRNESASSGINTTKEGNEGVGATKRRKMMKYLCFLAF